jgi:hypothetical protein
MLSEHRDSLESAVSSFLGALVLVGRLSGTKAIEITSRVMLMRSRRAVPASANSNVAVAVKSPRSGACQGIGGFLVF